MATINGISSGSNKIGSPFTIGITAANYSNRQLSFHNIKLEVRAYLYDGEEQQLSESIVSMSTPTQNAERHDIDISSALRTAADNFEFSPTVLVQPHLYCAIVVSDEYMTSDGVVHRDGYAAQYIYPDNRRNASYNATTGQISYTKPTVTNGAESPAIANSLLTIGAYNDLERMAADRFKNLTRATDSRNYSRKPKTNPEIVFVGDQVVVPSACDRSASYSISTAGVQTHGGHPFFALPSSTPHYQIRFVNGLGLIESISVRRDRKVQAGGSATEYVRTTPELFDQLSRSIYRKDATRESWQMDSGPITFDWMQWFRHEFAQTEHAWVLLDNRWVPILIEAKENDDMLDTSKVELLSYSFTILFDIDGPVSSLLLV